MAKGKYINRIGVIALLLTLALTGCGADNADSALDERGASADIDVKEVAQKSSQNREEQEALIESEDDLTGQDTQEDSETSETEPETKSESETSEASGEEIDDIHDFGPVSYDLSALPAMENRLYAEWGGNIYFRQYSDEDIEKGALWANFGDIPDTEKEIMCLESDGTLTQVGTDYGHGTMFIVDGRLYSQRYTKRKYSTGDDFYDPAVYSCELDGSDVIEYASSGVLAVRGNWIICETRNEGMEGLAVINVQTGQERVLIDAQKQSLVNTQKQYSFLDYLGATEEEIFYYIHSGVHGDFDYDDTGADENLVLYSVDYEGNIRELTTITRKEYAGYMGEEDFFFETAIHIHYFKIMGDEIYFSAGTDNGSAQMYSGGPIYSMKKDGSECKAEEFSFDDIFYLYDDEVNRILYCSTRDERSGRVAENGRMIPISLMGDGDTARNIILRPAYGYPYDEPYVHGSTNSVLLYPDTSGICYVLLTERDSEALSIDAYVDGHFSQDIKDVEYLGGKLFFTVTDLTYSMEDSIGWRDGYVRGRTACYCKDMESGEISLLYEY